jgi:hypothetical protein
MRYFPATPSDPAHFVSKPGDPVVYDAAGGQRMRADRFARGAK